MLWWHLEVLLFSRHCKYHLILNPTGSMSACALCIRLLQSWNMEFWNYKQIVNFKYWGRVLTEKERLECHLSPCNTSVYSMNTYAWWQHSLANYRIGEIQAFPTDCSRSVGYTLPNCRKHTSAQESWLKNFYSMHLHSFRKGTCMWGNLYLSSWRDHSFCLTLIVLCVCLDGNKLLSQLVSCNDWNNLLSHSLPTALCAPDP